MLGDVPGFDRYIGIDYSGAQMPTSSLPGLRVYAGRREHAPKEVRPRGARKHWTRRGVAEWLLERLSEGAPTLVGIDHSFSFPLRYFEAHRLRRDWAAFLDDFRAHWPTDEDHTSVEMVREGSRGRGEPRGGDSHWRRLTELRAGAKSVFHFDVAGSVAKSTHAGLPWLLFLRQKLGSAAHWWPFEGWAVPGGRSVVAEVYPSLLRARFPRGRRSGDQQDAFSAAEWMRRADLDGSLRGFFAPSLTPSEREVASVEGWILGCPGADRREERA
jgi:hypothetical protein